MKTRKDTFWELSITGLQEDFWDNEALALSYLNWKFGEEVTDEIKTRIAESLSYDDRQYDS